MSPITFRRKTIRSDKTVGEHLEAKRVEKKLTLADVERATRVREKYLSALETGKTNDLPESVYTAGFIRRYAQFLGLDADALLKGYRAEVATLQKLGHAEEPATTQLSPAGSVSRAAMVLTPKLVWVTSSLVVVTAVAFYVWYQVYGFMSAPALTVALPNSEMIVETPSVAVAGHTEAAAYVTINAEPIALAPDGTFNEEVRLEKGVNTIEIAARNRLHKETKKLITILANY